MVVEALRNAGNSHKETPLGRLTQILVAACNRPDLLPLANGGAATMEGSQPNGSGLVASSPAAGTAMGSGNGDPDAALMVILNDVLQRYQFQNEPLFAGLKPLQPEAKSLLGVNRRLRCPLDTADQLWLNRHLLEAALHEATGRPCLRRLDSGLDGILVSDVGKPFRVEANRRAGGLIRTALRSTDILMDRVWQLEMETFQDTPGFVFAPVTDVVETTEDPTAPHPEVQRQAAKMRTDLDRFSSDEISSLVRHGYCVGRKSCRSRPDLFGSDLPETPPWDPIRGLRESRSHTVKSGQTQVLPGKSTANDGTLAATTTEARRLQPSAVRRIWSTLLDYRDWTSYVYVPLLIPIFVLLPYFAYRLYQRSHQIDVLMDSISQGSPDLEHMSLLLDGPEKPWIGVTPEEVHNLDATDFKGFEIYQDSRLLDLRKWNPSTASKSDTAAAVYGYRRLKILKQPDNVTNNLLRIRLLPTSPLAQVRFPSQTLQPKLLQSDVERSAAGEKTCLWEASVDFHKVPAGDFVDVIYEHLSPGEFLLSGDGFTSLAFDVQADTAEMTRWLMLPHGKEYRSFRTIRYPIGKPEKAEDVKVVTEYLAQDYTILAYKLLSVKAGYTYEVTWYYK
jgi:hypothetical protein